MSDNGPEVHSRGKDGNSSGEFVLGQTTGFCQVAWALETQEVPDSRQKAGGRAEEKEC